MATLSVIVFDALASPALLREDCSILKSTFASASNPAPVAESPRLMPPASLMIDAVKASPDSLFANSSIAALVSASSSR